MTSLYISQSGISNFITMFQIRHHSKDLYCEVFSSIRSNNFQSRLSLQGGEGTRRRYDGRCRSHGFQYFVLNSSTIEQRHYGGCSLPKKRTNIIHGTCNSDTCHSAKLSDFWRRVLADND